MPHKYDYPSGGKGDSRIMPQVSENEFSRRWAATFEQNAPHDADRTDGHGLSANDDYQRRDTCTDPVVVADADTEEEG